METISNHFEMKMAWWLIPFPSPKEMKVQSPQWSN
jgi:hypothetical protein